MLTNLCAREIRKWAFIMTGVDKYSESEDDAEQKRKAKENVIVSGMYSYDKKSP